MTTTTPEELSYFETPSGIVLVGSCLDRLRDLDDGSIDSIVTDPPYEIGFMGRSWDSTGIAYSVALWEECLRVLKPGGHLLAFGATRSYHRMACAIEDAGFEIRDSLHWSYGSGFPKSMNVGKAIDKQKANRDEVLQFTAWVRDARDAAGITNADIDAAFGFAGMAGHWTSQLSQPSVPTLEQIPHLLAVLNVDEMPEDIARLALRIIQAKGQPGPNWFKREVTGTKRAVPGVAFSSVGPSELNVTAPATPEAEQWDGWGTALKPSHEPIVVARKLFTGTVAGNVLTYGTGALNIDGCRVGTEERMLAPNAALDGGPSLGGGLPASAESHTVAGRWPANSVFTHNWDCDGACTSGCPVADLDSQSGNRKVGAVRPYQQKHTGDTPSSFSHAVSLERDYTSPASEGGASRFFTQANWDPCFDQPVLYYAKPSKRERNAGLDKVPVGLEPYGNRTPDQVPADGDKPGSVNDKFTTAPMANVHPTVKPVTLMRHLCRLVTPPGGTVLDPFLGSGTTAVAAILEGFQWVGCEMTADYLPIISGRVAHAEKQNKQLELPL